MARFRTARSPLTLGASLTLSLSLSLVACTPPSDDDAAGTPAALGVAARAKLSPTTLAALQAGEPQRLLVVIDPRDPAAAAAAADPATATADTLLDWPAAKIDVAAVATDSGLAIDDVWDQLPIIPVTAPSLAELIPLLDDPRVLAVDAVTELHTLDAESFALVGQPAAAAAGKLGAGTTVAVLDTGADYTNPAFGCTAPGVPATCKIAVARDIAPDDGARDASGHGTNVAGIVVGVAPGARVLALDVFHGTTASSDTILAAYNWVLQNRVAYNVAAINLSLGGGRATAPCATDAMAIAFQTGRNAGVVTTVASGNDGAIDATAWPACAPAAISVGAVYDAPVGGLAYSGCSDPVTAADRVTCFSNSAAFLTLLAPGALIDAAGIRMAGTSQAAPHVAGAAAVLRAALPTETASQLVARLVSKGKPVVDARTGRTTPRLDLPAALGLAAAPVDRTAPRGTVVIDGNAAYARSRTVTLTSAATDAVGVVDMCVGQPCTAYVPYAARLVVTLPVGADGARTVTVRYRDRAGNVSAPATDAIIVDTAAPTPTLTASPAAGKITLRWTATDAMSGVASYRLVGAPGTTAPAATCTVGSTLASGATVTSYVHGPLAIGARWSYRLCATDRAGNTTAGVATTITVR